MKKISLKNLIPLLFTLAVVMAAPAFAAERARQYVPGEALVVIDDPSAARSARSAEGRAAALAASARGHVVSTFSALSEASGSRVFTLIRSETRSTEELIEALKADPSVIAAAPNLITRVQDTRPNDFRYNMQWGMKSIGAEAAWDVTSGDETIYVAVLDTGIQSNHGDLAANVDLTLAMNFTKSNPDEDVADGDGHGTHVAGIIGAVGNNRAGVTGVNWRVKIIPLKILDDMGEGRTAMLVAALDYIAELMNDPNKKIKIVALNLSLGWYGGAPSDISYDPIWRALGAIDSLNVAVMVFAAGNDGVEVGAPLLYDVKDDNYNVTGNKGQYVYPASYTGLQNAIVTGALNRSNAAANFTNWSGAAVHLIAPGVDIYSTYNNGSYAIENGTSMAAPHVTGAAALLAAHKTDWSARKIKERLLRTADYDVNPRFSGSIPTQYVPDKTVSAYGLLRIDRALDDELEEENEPAAEILVFQPSAKIRDDGPATVRASVGETITLIAAVMPYNATDKNVTWSSSDPDVLTVDENGRASSHSKGRAAVTAETRDAMGSINIEVTDAADGSGGCAASAGALPVLAAAFYFVRWRARTK